jgi:Kdo2-lipid IVA lauroyltransferase/acyltransferase
MQNECQRQKIKSHVASLKPTWWGRLAYLCFPFRKKIVLKNMHFVFDRILDETEIKKLAICFYSHIIQTVKEWFLMQFMTLEKIKQKGVLQGQEHFWNMLTEGKGAIILTGHFGNWDLASITAYKNLIEGKANFYVVRKPIKSKIVEKLVFRNFHRAGLNIILKNKALEQIRTVLKKNNIVVFAMDQHACLKVKDGISVNFFGKKAGTFKSLAVIARHMKIPVLPSRTYRCKDGKHVVEFFPTIPWMKHEDGQEEIALNTRKYNEILEQFVLDYPEQWNWMHRRWRDL